MPDHIHLLWIGLREDSNQSLATRHFRKHLNDLLAPVDTMTQKQAYDHVLKENEREKDVFESVVDYIVRNPERSGLVPSERLHEYPFTETLVPGYPEFKHPWNTGFGSLRSLQPRLRSSGPPGLKWQSRRPLSQRPGVDYHTHVIRRGRHVV